MKKIIKPSFSNLSKDFKIKLYTGVFAILIWIILATTQYPSLTTTINNVPLKNIDTTGTPAADYQLSPVGKVDQVFSVKINGFRIKIGSLSADDLEVYVNIQSVTKPGEYELPVSVRSKNGVDFEVKEITPKTVKVTFDTFTQKDFTIEPQAEKITAASGYIMEPFKANPDKITINGPKQDIDKITRVVLRSDKATALSESQSISDASLIIYNGDTIMDNSLFTMNSTYFNLEVPIFMKKTLPLKLTIRNTPPNFNVSSIHYKQSEPTIDIAAPNSLIADLGEKHLGYVELSNIDIGKQFTFNVPLESSYKNLSGFETVTVNFELKDYASKTFTLRNNQFHIINTPSNCTTTIKTTAIYNIKIIGPKNVISKLTSRDLIAEVDMSDTSINDTTYTLPVSIYAPDYNNVWAYGDYNMTIDLKKNN